MLRTLLQKISQAHCNVKIAVGLAEIVSELAYFSMYVDSKKSLD